MNDVVSLAAERRKRNAKPHTGVLGYDSTPTQPPPSVLIIGDVDFMRTFFPWMFEDATPCDTEPQP
jgi:hypothetical protein